VPGEEVAVVDEAGGERDKVEGGGLDLPAGGVEEVFREFRTCEFSSLARDG